MTVRFLPRWEVADVTGAVVAVDVIRAFTTAAYAFAAGARHIYLVDSVDEALALSYADSDLLVMGEDHGRRPAGFDFSNSPVAIAATDLDGRELVQRTSAGTRGVIAARSATRLWCASLVCASATAAAVRNSGLGDPTYVITGNVEDRPDMNGADDQATAELIERARLGRDLLADRTSDAVATSDEARRTLTLGAGDVDPDDIAYATRVDAFDFAMEVSRINDRLRLDKIFPSPT
jgi:2-phosphosulfolactate phosphatase